MSDKLIENILNFFLNNMGNKEMIHLSHYIESRAEFWQEIQKLKADREVLLAEVKRLQKIIGDADGYYGDESEDDILKSIGEID
jgi:hypothetical protein